MRYVLNAKELAEAVCDYLGKKGAEPGDYEITYKMLTERGVATGIEATATRKADNEQNRQVR